MKSTHLNLFLVVALLTQFAAPLVIAAPLHPLSSDSPLLSVATIPTPAQTYNTPLLPYLALPSPDGQHLFLGGQGAPFPLIHLQTGAVVAQFPAAADDVIRRAAFTPDGSGLLLNNILYNPLTGAVRRVFNANCTTAACAGVAVSPDGAVALIVPAEADGKTLQALGYCQRRAAAYLRPHPA